MLTLQRYIYLFEGGQAGHMAHPFDYTDFSANDLIDLVDSLFKGKIENLKEKLDGFNIMATMNDKGEVVFVRNSGNLNSEKGGMSIDDMVEKWGEREHQKKVFVQSGEIITKIFNKLGKDFFNPDSTHRKLINCECIIAGKTNVMPYATDRVAFHGYKVYELVDGKYKEVEDVEGHVDDIYKAAEGIDAAKPRPNLVIKSAEEGIKFAEKFTKAIVKLWEDEGLKPDTSVEEWKKTRFKKLAPEWCKEDEVIFNRLCNGDKSTNMTQLKKKYPEHKDELADLDKKGGKELKVKIIEPLDNLFLSIGNELMDQLDGFVNSENKDKIIDIVKKDTEDTINLIKNSDSVDAKDKLEKCMQRLQALGNKYNAAEGIVVMYKGRRMKFTGSFAALNQALGTRFMMEK